MPPIRSFLSRWIILTCVICYSNCQNVESTFENKTGYNQESRARIFSPRMDYDEWTPLGRGDPLKNDPTFDYVPPVLDRVQYWLDSHTTEPSAKRDILVLGVTAKKTSPKIPEQFLKFVDGPKFTRNQDQYRSEPVLHRTDFTGSSGAEPPKLVRTSNFKNGVIDYRNQNRIQNVPASYYPSPFYGQKPKPYTMMLPPPLIQKPLEQTNFSQKDKVTFGDQQFSTQTEEGPILQLEPQIYSLPPKNTYSQPLPAPRPSSKPPKSVVSQIETIKSVYTPPAQNQKPKFEQTTPSVSFEKSNLIYQSTQTLSGGWLASSGPSSSSSVSSVSSEPSSQVTWQTPANLRDHFDNVDHHVAASSSHEVVVGQNANIIVDGDSNDNEEVVIGQKEVESEGPSSTGSVIQPSITTVQNEENAGEIVMGQPSGSKMHIVMANTPSVELEDQKTKSPIAVVMPTNYMDKLNVTVGDGPKPSPATPNNFGNAMASEMKQTLLMSNPAPSRNSLPSPPMPPRHEEHHPYLGRPMPPQMAMHQPSMHHTAFPMGVPQQMMQQRPSNSIMQYLPNMSNMMHPMESHIPYRSPPMTHAQPPMTHMHGPPPKPMMRLPTMEQLYHQKFPQVPITFTNPPIFQSSTNNHVSRPDDPAQTMMLSQSPMLPTVPPPTPETVTPGLEAVTDYIKNESPLAMILNNETRKLHQTSTAASIAFSSSSASSSTTPAPSPPPPTTTVPSLTTDPIFSHYKQPAKPIRGPMYLIIQGHSKVKTYKPSVNKHGVPVENNEIQESTTERLSKLEQLINENTKGSGGERVTSKMRSEKPPEQRLGQESLLSLVESGFSAFTVPPPPATEEERETNSVTTIEINN